MFSRLHLRCALGHICLLLSKDWYTLLDALSAGLPQAPGEAGQDSAGSLSPNPGLASDAANAAHGVQNKDRIVYENILGQGNVFSLRLQE